MYSEYIIKMIPKVLTQVDRDKHSKNYGDCDRNHWHLKVRDFSSAILQQTGLSIALLYMIPFEDNVFYQKENVKEWAEATVRYWRKIQLRDGSFNEYYPNEHGFPPTAFSLYAMSRVYHMLNMDDRDILKAFRKTAKYLCDHIEEKAFNQEIASITALYSVNMILQEQWIEAGIERKLQRILELQSEEGWFPEYGGADIGYLSVSLDMLSEYYWLSKDERVIEPLEKMIDFLQYFVHPDATCGGEYASRNTIYFLPCGLQTMASIGNKTAEAMLNLLYQNTNREYYFLDAVDDRYFSHYLMHSFLRATARRDKRTVEKGKLPFEKNIDKYFKCAGLKVHCNDGKYVIVGGQKGGVCKAYHGTRLCFEDFGYRVKLGEGKIATTNWQSSEYKIDEATEKIIIKGYLNCVKQKTASPLMLFGLRVASAVLGNKIIGMLKRMIILVDKQTNIYFERSISLLNEELLIEDYISSPNIITLECANSFSLRHVASGKFYTMSDIGNYSQNVYPNAREIKIWRKYNFLDDKISEHFEYSGNV